MRLVAVGGVVTLLSVFGLRTAFHVEGPYREYCDTLSVSPDDRFQLEAWQETSLDPLSRRLDIFANECSGDGWLVLRETANRDRIAETTTRDLWMVDRYRRDDSDLVTWEARGAVVDSSYSDPTKVLLPAGLASIPVPAPGRKCDEVSASPDDKYRLEVWSRHRPLGCIGNGGPGDVLLIENGSERVLGRTPTSSVQTVFGMVHWGTHQVDFDVSRGTDDTYTGVREHLSY